MRVLVILVFLALVVKLISVQALSSGRYSAIGSSEVTTTVQLSAVRGGIFDRNGAPLAMSVPRSTVVADPYLIHRPDIEAAALTSVLGVPVGQLRAELSLNSGFVYLAHRVDDSVANKVRALALPGISLLPDTMRVDPSGQLALPLVGTVGTEGSGQGGLEYQFNRLLAGHDGNATEEVSPDGVPLPGGTLRSAGQVPGTGIELTIDAPLQYVTEQSLGAELLASHAKSGIAIVMNSHTGDILAMANLVTAPGPTPTPPTPAAPAAPTPPGTPPPPPPPPPPPVVEQAPQNLALTQVYEPGSVFKVVTFSAALQDGIISPDEVFTVPNSLTIDGWVFHDAESHPTERLTATQILAQSSNIGTIEIAQQLGVGRLSAQIGAMGFGRGSGLGFPAESPGLVKSDPGSWSVSDIGSTPIGQDDAVTAQQVLDMINTVGTRGVFVSPRLVRATVAADGSVRATARSARHRSLSPVVASELTTMMEQVVQDGTAVSAGVPGYTVAGKTGTAQIPDSVHGGYQPGAYMATFAGFAPAEHPALSAIVVLDQPSPIFGGVVAAPVFSQIMRYALHRYSVPSSPGDGTTGGAPQPVPYSQVTVPAVPATTAPPTTIAPSTGTPTEGP